MTATIAPGDALTAAAAAAHASIPDELAILPTRDGVLGVFNRAFFWTDERATLPYDLWVIAILGFVWLVPPEWLGDPMASGSGLLPSLFRRVIAGS